MAREQRVAVLGGGVAGAVAAAGLARHPGVQVELYEKAPHLGGLQRSVTLNGAVYDIGAFIFTADHELFRLFPTLVERFQSVRPIHRSITPTGRLDRYPSTVRGFIRDNGAARFSVAVASLLLAKMRYRRRDTLPSLVRYYLGDVFYEHSGFRTYIERLYGLPDHDIDVEFAATRLFFLQDVCSLRQRAARAVRRIMPGIPPESYDRPDVFVRPREGFGAVYAMVSDELRARGVAVHTSATLRAVRRTADGGFVLELPDRTERFDRVISTLPVAVTAQLVGEQIGGDLDYMKLISLFYRFRGESGHDAAVLCNLTRQGRWKRLVSFGALYGPQGQDDYFVVEVTAREAGADAVARSDVDFRQHVAGLGFFRGVLTLEGSHVTEHAYPVYRVSDSARLREARRRLEAWGIDLLGRQGRFDYATSAMVASQALSLADAIAPEDTHAP